MTTRELPRSIPSATSTKRQQVRRRMIVLQKLLWVLLGVLLYGICYRQVSNISTVETPSSLQVQFGILPTTSSVFMAASAITNNDQRELLKTTKKKISHENMKTSKKYPRSSDSKVARKTDSQLPDYDNNKKALSSHHYSNATDSDSDISDSKLVYHKVKLRPDESFMWNGRQQKLCSRIRKEMDVMKGKIKKSKKNGTHDLPSDDVYRMALYLGLKCRSLHDLNRHGNLILGLYAMHLAAFAHDNVDFLFACQEEEDRDNVFWWLQTTKSHNIDAVTIRSLWQQRLQQRPPLSFNLTDTIAWYQPPRPSTRIACSGMGKIPLHYTSEISRLALRNMAIQRVGVPQSFSSSSFSSSLSVALQSFLREQSLEPPPLKYELDEVAIHFRCGDILGSLDSKRNDNYGMAPFWIYRDAIEAFHPSRSTDNYNISIGIVSAPFQQPQKLRKQDTMYASQCQDMVHHLQDYLKDAFPLAKVSIRNDPQESIPVVWSRIILSELSICVRSTFCLYPTMATFGQGLFFPGGVAYFMMNVSNVYENIHVLTPSKLERSSFHEEQRLRQSDTSTQTTKEQTLPYLLSHEIKRLGWNQTLNWLVSKS